MKRQWFALCVALIVLIGFVGPVAAQDNSSALSRIVKNGEIRIGMSGSQPPFTVKSKEGKLIGYEVELAEMLANAMNVELELVQRPFPQLMAALLKGDIDAVMSGMTMTPERNLKVAFVGPYIVSGKSILTKDRVLAEAQQAGVLDRSDFKIAVLADSTSEQFVKEVIPKAQLVSTLDYDLAVQMVLDDKVKALVADLPICVLSALRHSDKGLVAMTTPLTIEPIGIALPPNDPLLLNMVQNYLGALEGLGVLAALEAKWFDDSSWLIQIP